MGPHLICGDFARHVLWAVQRVGKGVLVRSSMQTLKETLDKQSDLNILYLEEYCTTEEWRVSSLAQCSNSLQLLGFKLPSFQSVAKSLHY